MAIDCARRVRAGWVIQAGPWTYPIRSELKAAGGIYRDGRWLLPDRETYLAFMSLQPGGEADPVCQVVEAFHSELLGRTYEPSAGELQVAEELVDEHGELATEIAV